VDNLSQNDLDTLAAELGAALLARGWLLACAESCTGGWAAQAITAIAGSSAWFERGFVAYSNEAKREMLDVRADVLEAHGAVSEETAREMALGALTRSHAHLAFAITGIAGPGGGTPEIPLGTVCFAWALEDGRVLSERHLLAGDRGMIRAQSVRLALRETLALVR